MVLSETLVSFALHLIFHVRILQRGSVLNLKQFSSAKWISWSQWKVLTFNFLFSKSDILIVSLGPALESEMFRSLSLNNI